MNDLEKERGYFRHHGVNVMVFDDIYPEGHQAGVSVLMPRKADRHLRVKEKRSVRHTASRLNYNERFLQHLES